ncbi:MAG: type II CAAX prenyl endopeptidase Rce1 family protein [Candidatus Kapaibacterium sp.]
MDKKPDIYQEIQQVRNFPYVFFPIAVTLGIMMLYHSASASLFFAMNFDPKGALAPYIQGISQLLFMLVPVMLAARFIPIPRSELFRLAENPRLREILLGLFGIIGMQFLVSGWAGLQEFLVPDKLLGIYENLRENIRDLYVTMLGGGTAWAMIRGLIIGAAIPAIAEELLFRGFLQRTMEEKLRPWKAMLIAGAIFGLIHLNPIDVIPLMYIGFYLGFFAYYTKSIIVPIILHFANNALAIVVINVPELEQMDQATPDLPPSYSLAFFFGGLTVTIGVMRMIARRGIKNPSPSED